MPLNTGSVLNNRYRIVALLGQGGFGAVYRAWDLNLNRACAVKENLDASPEAQKQFGREATLLADLSHPNLVRVIDYFFLPGQGQYFIMDYVEGQDLEQILQANGPLPVDQVLHWARQICDALEYLHTHEPPVIHRDIKPANIKITPKGKAVLVDFGIAKIFDPQLRTTQGARAVTPGFSPPEQYGQGSTDHRTDIYALGATLYTALTGVVSPDSVDMMTGSAPKPAQADHINPIIPAAVNQALVKAMQLNRTERFGSMAEFLAALTTPIAPPGTAATISSSPFQTQQALPVQTNLPVPSPYQSPAVLIPSPLARAISVPTRKFPWALAVAGGLISLVLLGWAIWPKAPEATPPPSEPPREAEAIIGTEEITSGEETNPIEFTPTEIMPIAPSEPCVPATQGQWAGVDPRNQTVVWWHNHTGSREEGLAGLIAEFNATNDCGITIDAQNQGSYNDILFNMNTVIGTGELPDLVVGYQTDQAYYALAGGLIDINTLMNDPYWGLTIEELNDFYSAMLNGSVHPSFDNMRLGFPPSRSIEILYFNQTWLEELGFSDPPASPEEFRQMACAAAAVNGDGTGGYILRDDASSVAAWTYSFGGNVLSEDGTSYVYNNQATIESLTFLKSIYDDGCAYFFDGYPNTEVASRRAIFASGSSSGIPYYAGDIDTVAAEAGREPDVWGITAHPHITTNPTVIVYGGDVIIPATTPETELAAWLFIKWYTLPEVQSQWAQISSYFPTRASTREYLSDYIASNPQYGQGVDLLQFGVFEPQLISYMSVRDLVQQAFNQIMQGAPLSLTLDTLTRDANALQVEMMAP